VEEIDVDAATARADRRAERRRSYRITESGRVAVKAEARRLAALLASDAARTLLGDDAPG
jgi:hypothetical protein